MDNPEDLIGPQSDVPTPAVSPDVAYDLSEDEYVPHEGVQFTTLPHDMHDVYEYSLSS